MRPFKWPTRSSPPGPDGNGPSPRSAFDEKPLILAGSRGQKVLLTHIDVISAEALAFGER